MEIKVVDAISSKMRKFDSYQINLVEEMDFIEGGISKIFFLNLFWSTFLLPV